MGIFNRIKQRRQTEGADKEEQKPAADKEQAEVRLEPPKGKAGRYRRALISPRVSEKAAVSASKGTYVFNVPVNATKIEIRKAVEALYKVDVVAVRTVRNVGKIVRRGRISGQRNRAKKALVTLKAGQKIDLYEGV
jgi:large subunit ribosomal protein L23